MFKKSLLLMALLAVSANVQANTITPPPNTLNMNNAYPVNTAPSPVLQQGQNLGLQTPVVPSMATVLNQEIQNYTLGNLNPQQVADIKVQEALKNKMLSSPYLTTAEPVIRSLLIDLAPNTTPPVMRMSLGMLSTLVFTDIDGNPWEIEQVLADGRLFRVHGMGQGGSIQTQAPQQTQEGETSTPTPVAQNYERSKNMVMIEPLEAWSGSNIVVTLKGKQTPVIIIVTTGQTEVDLRLDMKVQGLNPDRKYNPLNMGATGVQNVTGLDESILGFLDGRIPDMASTLISSDSSANAWDVNGKTYVRTRLDVLHPAYTAKVSSGENTHVYRFDDLGQNRTVTLLQRYGQPLTVSFESAPYHHQ